MPDTIKKRAGEQQHSPGVYAEVRAVLASHQAIGALRTGSAILVRRGTGWLCADGWRVFIERSAGVGFGVYVAVYGSTAQPQALAITAPAAVGAWVIAAWTLAPPAAGPEPDGAEQDERERRPADPEQALAGTLEWIRSRIGDGRGVHLSLLLLDAHANGVLHDVPDVGQLRAVLEARGIPVRRSVKVAGEVAYGVHIDDLPKPSPTAPTAEGPGTVYYPGLPADLPANYESTTA